MLTFRINVLCCSTLNVNNKVEQYEMNKYRIDFHWKHTYKNVRNVQQYDWAIVEAKSCSDAARVFHEQWTNDSAGYKIIEICKGTGYEVLVPKKLAKKNWN